MQKLPIIYVRGFAGTTAGINGQVDDPFYGFNHGATHVRVGGDGDPMYYQFEGPLLRLMIDEDYKLKVHGDQLALLEDENAEPLEPATIWVYRFYDQAATTFQATPREGLLQRFIHKAEHEVTTLGFNIETAADGLYDLIQLVLKRTGTPEGKVYLVAHSMGGLICRSMMQKTCLTADKDNRPRKPAKSIVARLFTYGTPHGGITFSVPGGNWFEQTFGPAGADIFAPQKMYGYLTKGAKFGELGPPGWNPQVLPASVFDPKDVFCVVGTDPADYGVLPRTAVGPRSDGLVRIEHAYVSGAPRAFVHKSHSGPYGEVNSEEGYQNLRRFLFGKWQVTAGLVQLAAYDESWPSWQADVRLAIRGNSVVMSEQTASHWCPVLLNAEAQVRRGVKGDKGVNAPVPLVSTYLFDPRDEPTPDGRARYSLSLKVYQLAERNGSFNFAQHLEGVGAWEDTLIVDVAANPAGDGLTAWTVWNSETHGVEVAVAGDKATPKDPSAWMKPLVFSGSAEGRQGLIDLPPLARTLPILGPSGQVALNVTVRPPTLANGSGQL